jgi:hypothetical protein
MLPEEENGYMLYYFIFYEDILMFPLFLFNYYVLIRYLLFALFPCTNNMTIFGVGERKG